MTLPALDNLVRIGQLKAEEPAPAELAGLIRLGERKLADALRPDLNIESRFDLAYGAAHALSLAALRRHGYRSENRYVVFQSLVHTLNLEPADWRVLDQAHRKRNLAEYDGDLDVDDSLVDAILRVIAKVRQGCATSL